VPVDYCCCRYTADNILVHEFAHAVKLLGAPACTANLINKAFNAAKNSGRYTRGIYMMADAEEYFATASQAWFGAIVRTDVNDAVVSPARLGVKDMAAAAIMR
jgi:hypothetical protein